MHIDNYRIFRKIASGGMADVLLAVQNSLSRKVAIKIIHKELSENIEMIKRFKREAELVAKLNHPNIVQIFEDGVSDGRYYMVLEYMENGSLDTYIKNTKLSLKKILKLLIPIFSALEFIHSKGIVHRDLKPSNILLDKTLTPKLTDFGIATFLWTNSTRITTTNTAIGTVAYMSPEQSRDSKRVDHRADIYSMGAILYEITTGVLPSGNFPPPHIINKEITETLSFAIMKALSLDKMKRFPSIKLFKERIIEFLEGDKGEKGRIQLNEDTPTIVEISKEDEFITTLKKIESNSSLTEKLTLKEKLKEKVEIKHLSLIKEKIKSASGPLKEALLLSLAGIENEESLEILTDNLKDPFYREFAANGIINYKNEKLRKKGLEEINKLLNLPCEKIYKILALLNKNGINIGKRKTLECLNSDSRKIKETLLKNFVNISEPEDKKHIKFLINSEKDPEIKAKLKLILEKI